MKNSNNKNAPKGGKKKNPYTIYWIYAAIGLAIIGVQLFMGSSTTRELRSKETFKTLMENGYVEDVTLWRNVGRVDFRISDEGIQAIEQGNFSGSDFENIKRGLAQQNNRGVSTNVSPKFSFDIASVDVFLNEFDELNNQLKESGKSRIDYKVDEEHNYIGQIFSFLLPIIIIVAIWLFIMRRMAGGSGGPGGQILDRKSVV